MDLSYDIKAVTGKVVSSHLDSYLSTQLSLRQLCGGNVPPTLSVLSGTFIAS